MTKPTKELEVVLSDKVKAQIIADPKMAETIRNLSAIFRQAGLGIKTGQYKSMDDAIEALTGNRPEPVDPEDLEGL